MAGLQTSQYPSYHTLRLYGHSIHEKVFDPESGISSAGDAQFDDGGLDGGAQDLSFTNDLPRLEPSGWDQRGQMSRMSIGTTLTTSSVTTSVDLSSVESVKNIPLSLASPPKLKKSDCEIALQGILTLQDYIPFINPQIRPIPEELIYAESFNNITAPLDASRPEMYKTVMCEAWLLTAFCGYGQNCKFAHGLRELRKAQDAVIPSKYKTKVCFKYASQGICPHGNACLFVHPLPPGYTVFSNLPNFC